MEAFTTLNAISVPLYSQSDGGRRRNVESSLWNNVDTDIIIPKQFLKVVTREGLKSGLFYDLRHDEQGKPIDGFVLDEPCYRGASILIAGANFGCGSSREHAPWALLDAGFRAIIAPSFADIFYNNCFKNGILPIVLEEDEVISLARYAAREQKKPFTIDLPAQLIRLDDGTDYDFDYNFEIEPFRKKCLLEALDDIALTMVHEAKIATFEERNKKELPWLWS